MWLTVEVISALYLVSFAWFWSLCQLSIPDEPDAAPPQKSNIIPFERGIALRIGRDQAQPILSSSKSSKSISL